MQLTPYAAGGFGAEVSGLDLSEPLSADDADRLRGALDRYRLLVFRGQELTPEAQVRFARSFGTVAPPEPSAGLSTHSEAVPELQWLSYLRADGSEPSDRRPSQADVWHTDYAYLPDPAGLACLFGVEIPEDGPDTLFADMQGAYDALDPDRRSELRELRAIHQQRGGLDPALYRLPPYLGPGQPDDGSAQRQAAHPLVRCHPASGRHGLYMAQCYTIGIEGMAEAAAKALVAALYAHATQQRFLHRHVWRRGDLLVWDNLATNHRRSKPLDRPRVLHRVTMRRKGAEA
ncbi:taurine dioxygenase [Tistlia consotensis]|uniref:Taurine dioxygenase n=1 Tax=Tistlia consotensis USBA 355 TaxID=560819 RepID=A0A1Y6CSK1_9PROT|nr:TauD/TfdA family dioxygenase [Tistlia consotensis]SMF73449.1 taurine dioxygenase [Tistlia consotensis USBA 355]SNS30351.1 taurine dioxygenase [Tistlia consotensis]